MSCTANPDLWMCHRCTTNNSVRNTHCRGCGHKRFHGVCAICAVAARGIRYEMGVESDDEEVEDTEKDEEETEEEESDDEDEAWDADMGFNWSGMKTRRGRK